MPSGIGKRVVAAFALAIALLIANAIISFRATNTLVENNRMVVHTQTVIETLGDVLSAVKDAETSQRGYIITRDESFLRFYSDALPRVAELIAKLKNLTADNLVQQQRLDALERAINIRLHTLEQNLELARKGDTASLVQGGRMSSGKLEMDEVRRIGLEIQGEEDQLLAARVDQSEQSVANTLFTFIVANTLVLGLLSIVYIVVGRDLAERKRAAERLRDAHDQLEVRVRERTLELNGTNLELERSNRELQDFAFVASHDLQEPLRKIQAFGDRLKTKHGPTLSEEAQDYLKRMQGAASRMHTLINDLLTFSRVTTKAQPFIPTDLNEVAEDVLADLEVRVQDTGGKVELGELPTIDADPLQMRQLLQNLIGNALKFHRPGVPPIIKIKGETANGTEASSGASAPVVHLTFADNGIGFDEKYLDRIFTPFQRLHGRGEYEGTGIGLAVCRKIVERHGGSLTAQSKPGEGSTFTATLPVIQEKETT